MKNQWLSALLCAVFVFVATGCGTPRGADKGRRRAGATQTGTNIPRWIDDSPRSRDGRAKEGKAKPKREKKARAAKAKREREERRRPAADEEVITRGGFR